MSSLISDDFKLISAIEVRLVPFLNSSLRGLPPPFRCFSRIGRRKFIKLSEVIDLGNLSKSCHRLKIPRCLLLGDFGVTRAKMNHKFSPFFSETVRPIRLKIFLGLLRTNRGACFFFFWKLLTQYFRRSKILKALSKTVFFSLVGLFKRLPYLIEIGSWRKKKTRTPICPK